MRRIPAIMFGIAILWLATTMAAPFTIPSGSVTDLKGGAEGRIDHPDVWAKMNPFAMAVYYVGDLNCHQLSERSLYLNGNQMPVCARDVGVIFGFTIGTSLLFLMVPCNNPYLTAFTLFPNKGKEAILRRMSVRSFVVAIGIVLLLPMAIDGTIQFLTPYESTNPLRLATGLPAGIAIGLGLGAGMMTMFEMTEGDKRRWVERYNSFMAKQKEPVKVDKAKAGSEIDDGKERRRGPKKRRRPE